MDYPNYKYMEKSSNNNTDESKNDYFNNEKELKIVKIKLINQWKIIMKIIIISLWLIL